MVVGAKGSPAQLILSAVYHLDIPAGNIPYAEYERLRKHRMVRNVIPLALGDAYAGFRIVGTTRAYPEHYQAQLAQGIWFDAPFEAVLGAQVAQAMQARLGDTFVSNHGLVGDGHTHKENPYKVKGLLAPTGTVLDRLVLTPVESVWLAHGHHHEHEHHTKKSHEKKTAEEKEITALLVSFRSPAMAAIIPRQINRQSVAQAVVPAFEMARLLSMLGIGLDVMRGFGLLLVVMALLSIFVTLWQAMQQRRFDLAVMRGLGAGWGVLLRLVVLEGMLVTIGGIVLGMLLAWTGIQFGAAWLPEMQIEALPLLFSPVMGCVAGVVALCGLVASVIPALGVMRLPVADILGGGR